MKGMVLRQEFKDLPKNINWYPGHMRKAMTNLEEEIPKVSMLIEVRDARIPYTSHNPELLKMFPTTMKKLVVFNKFDLANEKKSLAIIKKIIERDKLTHTPLHISTKKSMNVN